MTFRALKTKLDSIDVDAEINLERLAAAVNCILQMLDLYPPPPAPPAPPAPPNNGDKTMMTVRDLEQQLRAKVIELNNIDPAARTPADEQRRLDLVTALSEVNKIVVSNGHWRNQK